MAIVELTPEAVNDLDTVWDWGEDHYGQAKADIYLDELKQALQDLALMPYAATERPELGEGIRFRPFRKKYTIFYKPIENGILVIRVLGSSQDAEKYF